MSTRFGGMVAIKAKSTLQEIHRIGRCHWIRMQVDSPAGITDNSTSSIIRAFAFPIAEEGMSADEETH